MKMRTTIYALLLIAIFSASARADDPTTKPSIYVNHAGLLKLGWQLAAIGSTFFDSYPSDMVDQLHSMNFHHIELSIHQIDPSNTAESDALMAKVKSVHMDFVSLGIVDPGRSEADARVLFELGKRLKIKTLVADPTGDSLEMLDRLANEYHINVAIVNAAKPGNHWDPDALAGLLVGRSPRIGVSANLAAWRASGIAPVDAVKKLSGHILQVRLMNFDNSDATDALAELKAEKFKGICAVGCALGPADTLRDRFINSINAFSKIVGDLSGVQ